MHNDTNQFFLFLLFFMALDFMGVHHFENTRIHCMLSHSVVSDSFRPMDYTAHQTSVSMDFPILNFKSYGLLFV